MSGDITKQGNESKVNKTFCKPESFNTNIPQHFLTTVK